MGQTVEVESGKCDRRATRMAQLFCSFVALQAVLVVAGWMAALGDIENIVWMGPLLSFIGILLTITSWVRGHPLGVAYGMKTHSFPSLLAVLLLSNLLVAAEPLPEKTATFSICAVDPESGLCGAAVASKYPAVGHVVPYVRAGVGAFCTQHHHVPQWGEPVLDLLAQGKRPEEILSELLKKDKQPEMRQLAIIDMKGQTAIHNPTAAPEESRYWAAMTGRYYCVQGNTLAGREVITEMAKAYEDTKGSFTDRLMLGSNTPTMLAIDGCAMTFTWDRGCPQISIPSTARTNSATTCSSGRLSGGSLE